jgi:hypothetical protein
MLAHKARFRYIWKPSWVTHSVVADIGKWDDLPSVAARDSRREAGTAPNGLYRRCGSSFTFCKVALVILFLFLMAFSTYGAVRAFSTYVAAREVPAHASILNMRYGFGPVIRSIVVEHKFGSPNKHYGWWCYACRLPLVPLLAAVSYQLSQRMVVFIILKNLVFWSIWFVALRRLQWKYEMPDCYAIVAAAILLIAPYTLVIAGKVEVEEGFLFMLLSFLFAFSISIDGVTSAVITGIALAAIYLTKSSMLLLCAAVAIWIVANGFRTNRSFRTKGIASLIPAFILVAAIIAWGGYNLWVSGVFAFGANSSSWNGWNAYKGNNERAAIWYPRIDLDLLDRGEFETFLLPREQPSNEWQMNQRQLELAQSYMRSHPGDVVKMEFKKLYVACCDMGEAPLPDSGVTRKSVVLSDAVNHIAALCALAGVLLSVRRRRVTDAEIMAMIMVGTYLVPYLAGFLYSRHMVPLYGIVAFTLAVQIWNTRRVRSLGAIPVSGGLVGT